MYILQIEHSVTDYDGWKNAFDNDPIDRQRSGVQSYRISRKLDDKNYLVIELVFDTLNEAEEFHEKLKELWKQVEGAVMNNPQSRIIEVIEDESIY